MISATQLVNGLQNAPIIGRGSEGTSYLVLAGGKAWRAKQYERRSEFLRYVYASSALSALIVRRGWPEFIKIATPISIHPDSNTIVTEFFQAESIPPLHSLAAAKMALICAAGQLLSMSRNEQAALKGEEIGVSFEDIVFTGVDASDANFVSSGRRWCCVDL